MRKLRRAATFRYLSRHPGQLVLSILGVALGVAVVVSLDLAVESSRAAFRASTATVAGRATHVVVGGPAGLDESAFRSIRLEVGLREVAPIVEDFASSPRLPGLTLRLLGVDPFSEIAFRPFLGGGVREAPVGALTTGTPGVFLATETARAAGLAVGDTFPLRTGGGPADVVLVGEIEPSDALERTGVRDLVIADIAVAQTILRRPGRLSRLDLILPEAGEEELLHRITDALPPDARIRTAGARAESLSGMIAAFDLNLRALSLLALVFGMFLIYNTITFSVVQRRRLIGSLRAIGVTRSEIFRGIALEAALLGVAGSAIGLMVGVVLGRGLVRLVTQTINDLYFVLNVQGLAVSPESLIRGAALGIVATLISALPPAWEATGKDPRGALLRSELEGQARIWAPRAGMAGVALLLTAVPALVLLEDSLIASFTSIFVIVLGLALLTPVATILLVNGLAVPAARIGGTLWTVATRSVVTSLSRTGPAIAALVVSVAVVIGLGSMITSFRSTLIRWLETTLQADVYVSAPSTMSARAAGRLAPEVVQALVSADGVSGASTYRATELESRYGPTRLVALDLDPRGEGAFTFLRSSPEEAFRGFRSDGAVFVSEPFGYRHDVDEGGVVVLPTELGEREFRVAGVFYDYGSERGTVMMARATYDRFWDDDAVTSLGLFFDDGDDAEARVLALQRSLTGSAHTVQIRSNRTLRNSSLVVFERTFAVTAVLRSLAFLVAFIGVLSALMALQLERSRELGLMRASGLTPGQLWRLVTAETGIVGLVAGLQAIPVGAVLAAIMVFVVNKRSFGWTLQMEVPPALLIQAVGLAVLGALLAGLYPAWRMSKVPPAEALRSE